MAQIYLHCASAEEVLLDRRGSEVEDLTEARECAVGVVRRFISRPGPEDWREWVSTSVMETAKRYSRWRSHLWLAGRTSFAWKRGVGANVSSSRNDCRVGLRRSLVR
jgi:Domain of unknown function (DUF6894)